MDRPPGGQVKQVGRALAVFDTRGYCVGLLDADRCDGESITLVNSSLGVRNGELQLPKTLIDYFSPEGIVLGISSTDIEDLVRAVLIAASPLRVA